MPRQAANLLVLFAAFLWGLSFYFQKEAMSHVGPLLFTGLRGAIAALALLPFVWREYRTITDYDGAVHLDEKKHTQDNQTRDLYAAHGWRHVALTKRMVRNMDAALERVARALRDNGWLG